MRRQVITWGIWLAVGTLGAPAAPASTSENEPPFFIYRVGVASPAGVRQLVSEGWDLLEARGKDYLLVLGDASVEGRLRAEGFSVSVDQEFKRPSWFAPESYYGGYRTVVEHYAHLDAVAAAHPELAALVTYGQSWRNVQNLPNGYPLRAICITNQTPGSCALTPDSTKPRFLLMSTIHARELTAAELAWRWIDELISGYGVDPDITALLDNNEMWVIPVVNPDGRSIVESGGNNPILQRKNANTTTNCGGPPDDGIDLNRNGSFEWGLANGSSTAPCDETYHGPAAASEPEESTLQTFFQELFPDQRGPNLGDAAPSNATGAMITLHTYSNLVLVPWGWVDCGGIPCPPGEQSPNNGALRAFGFRMSYFNSYDTGQASELLYPASGTTDDWSYGTLGIASATFEAGPSSGECSGFFPIYSCQDGIFWPINRGAFLFAAKNARTPYLTSLGPPTVNVALSAGNVTAGTPVTVTATVDDTLYGSSAASVGRPVLKNITAAEYYVDVPPWAGGSAIPMAAQDGQFNSTREIVTASVDTHLTPGRHTLFVRGQNASGNWGAPTAQWLTVAASTGHGFYTIAPCRAVDTRGAAGPYGAPALTAGASRDFPLTGICGIPADAVAVSLNVTEINAQGNGDFRLYATGSPAPQSSVLNFRAGWIRANNVIAPISGGLSVQADLTSGTADLVIDVNGYFR